MVRGRLEGRGWTVTESDGGGVRRGRGKEKRKLNSSSRLGNSEWWKLCVDAAGQEALFGEE